MSNHVFGNGRLSNIKAEFQQLAVNTRRTPKWMLTAHLTDEGSKLSIGFGSAEPSVSTFPCPKELESLAMPPNDSLWFDDPNRLEDLRMNPIEPNEQKAIHFGQVKPLRRFPLQDDQLLSEGKILKL